MEWLSEKLTKYIVRTGAVSSELYAVYQYGFQIGLEMLSCFIVCLGLAAYMHMIPEFLVFTGVFMLLRTYAGGLHLKSFGACFTCSIAVQTLVLLVSDRYVLPLISAWILTILSAVLVWGVAPVENINRELDADEKRHCKSVTTKILLGIIVFSAGCTFCGLTEIVSLVAVTVFVILISQYIGAVKYKIEKSK